MGAEPRTRVSGNGRQLCGCACHPDLSWMRFGWTKISPSDVDCLFITERRGACLFIEWKWEDEELPLGQEYTLLSLSKRPLFTVLILRGKRPGNPTVYLEVKQGTIGEPKSTSREHFADRVEQWFARVENGVQQRAIAGEVFT